MHLYSGSDISLHDAVEGLERLSRQAGLSPDELTTLLATDLEIEHVLAYLEAAAGRRMN